MRRSILVIFLAAFLALCFASCEKDSYLKARRTDTIEAYREYLKEYPQGDYAKPAEERIEELTLRKAIAARSIKKLRSYLEKYPDSKKKDEVRLVIRNFLEGKVHNLSNRELEKARLCVKTSMGSFRIKLFPKAAPENSRNLVLLAASDFYKELKVDMVKPGKVVLIGDLIGDRLGGPGYFVPFEKNDIKHKRGRVSIYHLPVDKDTGGSQFFITLKRMPAMDGEYTVVGEVVEGIEVVEEISRVETTMGKRGPFKPAEPIHIKDVTVEGIDLTDDGNKDIPDKDPALEETGGGG